MMVDDVSEEINDNSCALTAIIADDEPWLRQEVREQLSLLWPQLQIVGSCSDGQQALDKILTLKPDIVFLDIQMPFLNGLEVVENVIHNPILTSLPLVVFITAFDAYAIEAFQRDAVDYLLKPVNSSRLHDTVERLKIRVHEKEKASRIDAYQKELQQLKKTLAHHPSDNTKLPHKETLQHIAVNVGQKRFMVDMQDVLCIQSDSKYSKLVTQNGEYLVRESLSDLEEKLDRESFWRIHRSTILNVNHMDYCTPTVTGRLEVSLKNHDLKLTVSRKHIAQFKGL